MSTHIELIRNLEILKLDKIKIYISDYLDSIKNKDVTITEVLKHLTDKEIIYKEEKASDMNIKIANFPFRKELKDFDFDFQPSLNKKEIMDFENLRFIENKENILFFGTSGVGKTHLATAIGIAAAKKRCCVYFMSCHDLITSLNKAHQENKLADKIKHLNRYKLLIIDEIGYLPVDKTGANLLFQLITKRYEKLSTIITSNQPFSKWGEVFADNTLANALLDRLLHHSHVINITGKSYRIRDKIIKANNEKN